MVHPARTILIMAVLIASLPFSHSTADDIQVNTYTTGDQRLVRVAVDAEGGAVVTWTSDGSSGTDSSDRSVQAQRFAANGSPVGGEFQVNTHTTNSQNGSSVAMLPGGGFVIVWSNADTPGGIQGQRFASDGAMVGAEFQVNNPTLGGGGRASVAADADGDFVVVWHSSTAAGDPSLFSVHARRFSSNGEPAGDQFQVNTYTPGHQWSPSVAMKDTGEFVIAWESHDEFGGGYYYYSIHARRYASDGTPDGSYFAVTANNGEHEEDPAVAMDAEGNFVIVWDSAFYGLRGQRFGSDGSLIGDEFQVNTDEEYYPNPPEVAMAPDGAFAVVWHNFEQSGDDTSGNSVRVQRYNSDGMPEGDIFEINSYTINSQEHASVAAGDNGTFVFVWEGRSSGGTDNDGRSVQMNRPALIFGDGFESGNTSAWTNTVP